jgi:cation diffusion facilitator CzcD-associated flavoprotein CzcO
VVFYILTGVCATHRLLEFSPNGKNCEVVVFEQRSQLGGTWVFSDHPDDDSQRSM